MQDTLHDYGGVGLAAPQINEPWRLAIIEMGAAPSRYGDIAPIPLTTFVNPTIDVLTPDPVAGFWEGCLSVPGLRGYVERPQHIAVNYTDVEGQQQRAGTAWLPRHRLPTRVRPPGWHALRRPHQGFIAAAIRGRVRPFRGELAGPGNDWRGLATRTSVHH